MLKLKIYLIAIMIDDEVMMTFLNSESASSKTYEETIGLLKTDIQLGLQNEEALQRQKLYSFNEFEIKKEDPLWWKYLEKVTFFY